MLDGNKLINGNTLEVLVRAIGAKLHRVDDQININKTAANSASEVANAAKQAVEQLRTTINGIEGGAGTEGKIKELTDKLFGTNESAEKVAKLTDFNELKKVVDNFFAKADEESFDENLDTLKEIIDYIKNNNDAAGLLAKVNKNTNDIQKINDADFATQIARLSNMFATLRSPDDSVEGSIGEAISEVLRNYVQKTYLESKYSTTEVSDQKYLKANDIVTTQKVAELLNEHIFDRKEVVQWNRDTGDVNINLDSDLARTDSL